MKVLYDMASVIQTGLRKGEDAECYEVEHEGKVVKINTAAHGYENAVGYMVWVLDSLKLHASDAIMVFEGRDSKKRRMQILPTYKGGRGKSHPKYYEEYNKCKEQVKQVFRDVGALAITQDLAEGDDTLKYLAMHMEEDVTIVTNDGDLSVLAGVNAKGFKITVISGQQADKMPEGVFEAKHITLYKATVGDASDSVPGIKGFGQKKWDEMLAKYGGDGIDEISAAVAANDVNKIVMFAQQNKCKLLGMIADNWNAVRTCWLTVSIYEEWVNTRYYPMKWEPGIVKGKGADERLHKYAQVRILVTADNYDEALARLKATRAKYPTLPVALDVETSTNEESDDWMEARGKADGVDPLSSYLCGFSLSFGPGGRYTYYVSVKHAETNNVTMKQAREMIEEIHGVLKPIHNTSFELTIFYNDYAKDEDGTLWRDLWKDKGEFGFLPNIEDTLLMASYVDENAMSRGLKNLSKNILGYEQVDFNTMRTFPMGGGMDVKWVTIGDGDEARAVPNAVFFGGEKPFKGGKVITKTLKQPVMEDGKQVCDSKGKPKEATVYREVQAQGADGELLTVRKRNPATGLMENMPKMVKFAEQYQVVRYKMHEMPAVNVFDYGTDDTICTMAYYLFAKLNMIFDEHYHVYRQVEIDAGYQHAKSYYDGFPIAIHELVKQRNEDAEVFSKAEKTLHAYLIDKGWSGTVQPNYTAAITAAEVKEAYATVFGIVESEDEEDSEEAAEKDPVMSSRVKLIGKYIDLIGAQERDGAAIFAGHLRNLVEHGREKEFNAYIAQYFDGKPKFAYGNKDMSKLLYETMGMEVRVRNKATPKMKLAGIREGTPKADALAVAYAIADATKAGDEAQVAVLKALQLITTVKTRNGLFYATYPGFVHWESGKVHSSHRQCNANTRRASSADPNMQQLPVHAKIKGFESAFRRVVQPHKPGAVVVSLDFNAQELRSIADDSQDPNMLACYVGDNKKDMHSITGSSIAMNKMKEKMTPLVEALLEQYPVLADRVYYAFKKLEEIEEKLYGEYRSLGKKVNFTTEYGAMAPKLAATLMVSEEEAQMFIDAREAAFSVAAEWKATKLVKYAKEHGFVRTRLGAKRHLAEMLDSDDRLIASKAERQAVNFRIQGSCAEQTKLAEGRMWRAGLFTGKYDAVCYGPVHDEVVSSCMLDCLEDFIIEKHALMVQKYADMEVPVVSSIAFGPNFYDQIEIGEVPTREAIRAGVAKMKEKYAEHFA